jgi:hypothetical protein
VRLSEDGPELLDEARRLVGAVSHGISAEVLDGAVGVGVGMPLVAMLERADRMINASLVEVTR